MNLRFLADLVERMAWTFVQAYLAAWTVAGAGFDQLFTVNNLKVAVVAAMLVLASAVARRPIGDHDTISVLPAAPPPEVPQPAGLTADEQLRDLIARARAAETPPWAGPGDQSNVPLGGTPAGLEDYLKRTGGMPPPPPHP